MKLGNKTLQYKVYNRTSGKPDFVTDTTSYKRPDIEVMTDKISGAGIAGEIDMPTLAQLSAMEIEIGFKRANKKAVELFGQQTQELEVRWVTDVLDTTGAKVSTCANKDIIKAIPKKLSLGNIETNSTNEASIPLEVIYFKHIQDGEALIEIDKLNNVFIVNGVDYAKPIREAL